MAGPASAVQRQAAVGAGRPRSPRADSDRRAPSHQHRVPFCSSPQSAAFQLHSYKVSGSDVQTMSVVVSLYSRSRGQNQRTGARNIFSVLWRTCTLRRFSVQSAPFNPSNFEALHLRRVGAARRHRSIISEPDLGFSANAMLTV
jgi:hypothetical protein